MSSNSASIRHAQTVCPSQPMPVAPTAQPSDNQQHSMPDVIRQVPLPQSTNNFWALLDNHDRAAYRLSCKEAQEFVDRCLLLHLKLHLSFQLLQLLHMSQKFGQPYSLEQRFPSLCHLTISHPLSSQVEGSSTIVDKTSTLSSPGCSTNKEPLATGSEPDLETSSNQQQDIQTLHAPYNVPTASAARTAPAGHTFTESHSASSGQNDARPRNSSNSTSSLQGEGSTVAPSASTSNFPKDADSMPASTTTQAYTVSTKLASSQTDPSNPPATSSSGASNPPATSSGITCTDIESCSTKHEPVQTLQSTGSTAPATQSTSNTVLSSPTTGSPALSLSETAVAAPGSQPDTQHPSRPTLARLLQLIGPLTTLTQLTLQNFCHLTTSDASAVADTLPSMSSLNLQYTQEEAIKDVHLYLFAALQPCRHLRTLAVSAPPAEFLPQLGPAAPPLALAEVLEQSPTEALAAAVGQGLHLLSQLTMLTLQDVELAPRQLAAALKGLTALTSLCIHLRAARIQDVLPVALTSAANAGSLQQLQHLSLDTGSPRQTRSQQDAVIEAAAKHLPLIQVLELPQAVVEDRGAVALAALTGLRELKLAEFELQSPLPEACLSAVTRLTLTRALLYHLAAVLPLPSLRQFSAELSLISWLCPMDWSIWRAVEHVVSSISHCEDVRLDITGDLSWRRLIPQLAGLPGLRQLSLEPLLNLNQGRAPINAEHIAMIAQELRCLEELRLSWVEADMEALCTLATQLTGLRRLRLALSPAWASRLGDAEAAAAAVRRAAGRSIDVQVK